MTDFIKFCPKCRTLFRDSDLYHRHLATCGAVQAPETESVPEPKKATGKETADRRRQAAEKRSQEQGVRSQNTADKGEPSEAGSETSGFCHLSPDSSTTPDSSSSKPKFKT